MSNGVFNFNFLALLISEILGGPKFTLGGPTPPGPPSGELFFAQSEYFTMSNCVFNFNILALVLFGILGCRGGATVLKFFLTPHFLASGGGDKILLR